MIGYKTFKSEQEFLDWQEAEAPKIFQVSPLVLNMKGVADPQCVDMNTAIGCFVLYQVDALAGKEDRT
jgi:hypothetical protein